MANANDNFTGTNGTNLTAHTSDSGHSWTKVGGGSDAFLINNNTAYRSVYGTEIHYYISAAPSTAEYDVQATVSRLNSATGNGVAIIGRASISANTFYWVYWRHSTDNYRLMKRVAGVDTQLGAYSLVRADSTETIKLEIRDATKKVYINGVERISSSDNAITDAGRAGISVGKAADTTVWADDWSVTDAGGGGGLSIPVAIKHYRGLRI